MKQVDPVSTRLTATAIALTCVTIAFGLTVSTATREQGQTIRQGEVPRINTGGQADWASHNLDLHNRRYATLDEIKAAIERIREMVQNLE